MNIKRLEELLSGHELPMDPIEDIFVYVHASAIMGNQLFDIYLEIAKKIDDDDVEALVGVLLAYALAEKQIAEYGTIDEGEIQ